MPDVSGSQHRSPIDGITHSQNGCCGEDSRAESDHRSAPHAAPLIWECVVTTAASRSNSKKMNLLTSGEFSGAARQLLPIDQSGVVFRPESQLSLQGLAFVSQRLKRERLRRTTPFLINDAAVRQLFLKCLRRGFCFTIRDVGEVQGFK